MNKEELFELFLMSHGFNLHDPNFADTPRRMVKVYQELLYGHTHAARQEISEHLLKTFPSTLDELIIVRNIDSVGVCPHHFLPVQYLTHVGYIPDGKVIGLSKIPRLVKILSSRAVIQETLVSDIATMLMNVVEPKGVAVYINGKHSCSTIRGVKSHKTEMVTSCLQGCLQNQESKLEFLTLCQMS